ncbi:unnamed protein product [Vitrella brassicaformis CCMP3155]|uniref:Uncharacterized protein n=1 Tax=Vitrella brassicaformis (strain CCMP3155) TaxID=1169540 RepID=A0A0G4FVM7_VITBC|nr:unnamed protein product [Vitrella brassicaformis CCMP3155]|eukprot:CEM19269.1 unnamed protein product [Vitrella brassicaformis CCMP3155]
MVVPISLQPPLVGAPPPPAVTNRWKPALIIIVCLQASVTVLRLIIHDIWGAFTDIILLGIGYCAIKEDYTTALYCVWYCVLCAFNCIFGVLILVTRAIQEGTQDTPFKIFPPSDAPTTFLFIILLLSPLLGAAGAFVSWKIYKLMRDQEMAYLAGTFYAPPPPQYPIYGAGPYGAGPYGYGGQQGPGYGAYYPPYGAVPPRQNGGTTGEAGGGGAPPGPGAQGQQPGAPPGAGEGGEEEAAAQRRGFRPFSGEAHRLG